MDILIKAIFAVVAWRLFQSIRSAQKLDFKIDGLIPTIQNGKIILGIRTKIKNEIKRLNLNSIVADVTLNGQTIGLVNYSTNEIIPVGISQVIIPVQIDPLLDSANIITALSAPGSKDVSVTGTITIDGIALPYSNTLLQGQTFDNFINSLQNVKL